MAIPKYFEMYRSFLECLADGQMHTIKEMKQQVGRDFSLSDDDLAELLPSGKQRVFDNRIGWCRTYLKKAELIVSPGRAQFSITDAGKKLLAMPGTINDDTLMQFPSFVKFKNGDSSDVKIDATIPAKASYDETPQETLDRVYKELNNALANELLSEIIEMDPYKFESLVIELLIKMGYGKMQFNSHATKKSGDEGIDGIVTADKLGFDSIYIQAKRYSEGSIGRPEIQKFVGALAGQGAQKGIFITTSRFTKEAEQFVQKNLNYKIVLIDGTRLAELMIEYELGVTTEYTYRIKRIDTDFFTVE